MGAWQSQFEIGPEVGNFKALLIRTKVCCRVEFLSSSGHLN